MDTHVIDDARGHATIVDDHISDVSRHVEANMAITKTERGLLMARGLCSKV